MNLIVQKIMSRNLIILTVDCLRADAISRMPKLQDWISTNDNFHQTTYATSHSTKWSCSAFLTGKFYPEIYDKETDVLNEDMHLAGVLSRQGYQTGAFIAANPNVNDYLDSFDMAWNGGYGNDGNRSELDVMVSRFYKLLRMKKEIPAQRVLNRAKEWYEKHSRQRFLWIHLMEPHEPYLPGFRRATGTGLLSAYWSVIRQYRANGELSDRRLRKLESLYWKTVKSLDDTLSEHLGWLTKDSIFVLSADHGEVFTHGRAGHHGWSDDVLEVPVVSNEDLNGLGDLRELPPELLEKADITVPDELYPKVLRNGPFVPEYAESDDTVIAVLRGDDHNIKIEYTDDDDFKYIDLDSGKSLKKPPNKMADELSKIKKSINQSGVVNSIHERDSTAVEKRLKDLGYK